MMIPEDAPIAVLKFGGTSVSNGSRWRTIADIIRARIDDGLRPLVVCSATSGTSNHLERILTVARDGGDWAAEVDALVASHRALGHELGVEVDALIAEELADLQRLLTGARLIGETSPRLRARVMATGELMSTRIGAHWLRSEGIPVSWLDARSVLLADDPGPRAGDARRHLAATCTYEPDPELRARITSLPVTLTQGFLARDLAGETVLLGRGGSDVSAAYFAAKVGAERLEIWTDVPGLFTANPRHVPEARIVRQVDYDEALMLASLGAKVIHPRCVAPARDHDIPIHVRCTWAPKLEGTVISWTETQPAIKGVVSRRALKLFQVGRPGRWQPVGFLAAFTECFSRNELSIDLISTSPSSIRATLDLAAAPVDEAVLGDLERQLHELGDTAPIVDRGSVSLVGSQLRDVIQELSGVLQHVQAAHVDLLTQAADDSNLTFVVPVEEVPPLVRALHAELFGGPVDPAIFGPTWSELVGDAPPQLRAA